MQHGCWIGGRQWKAGTALSSACACPVFVLLWCCVLQGAYTLTLEFESKLELSQWQDRLPKIQSFFGPGELPSRLY